MKTFQNPFAKLVGPPDRCYRTDLFCDSEQPDYVQLECGSELGGIVAVSILDSAVEPNENTPEADLENPEWWDNLVTGSPQQAWIILDTRGSLAAGTPTEEEGFGLQSQERTGDDRELTFEALGVMNNRNFWAAINRKRNHKLVYLTAGRDADGNFEAFYVENASIYASEIIDQSVKSRKRYTVSAKWSTAMIPALPFHAPASIFTLSE